MKKILIVLSCVFTVCSYAQKPVIITDSDDQATASCIQKASAWCAKKGHHCKIAPKAYCLKKHNII